ncbi:hypothetical protein CKALI_02410 [Corynebacterium kalinowskii]|uniref:Esterase n=2 Tax=Corynebacterium kalinowskii TaxID=2675216 RepID=A0A6B8VNL2_9CORY|nr:hypothetical protein CKALI_02410 [Corynebacterium kalinowskii]
MLPTPKQEPDVQCSWWEKGAASVASPFGANGVELGKNFTSNGVRGNYHVFAEGIDFSRPVRVVVRLHGDGAREYDVADGLTACLADQANRHNAINVVPKSPDTVGSVTWWEDIPRNREWLGALLQQEIYPRFGLSAQDSVWMGYSGGAEMITYGILPRNSEWIGQSATMVGGGGAPHEVAVQPSAAQRENLELAWVVGLNDDGRDGTFNALGNARAGAEFYRSIGFARVQEAYPAGYDHVSVPQIKILDQRLSGEAISLG